VDAIQVPAPLPFAMIEGEQCLFGKRGNKLNGEKRIAARFIVDQLRQGTGPLRIAVKRIS
jgi:hypothetical protein